MGILLYFGVAGVGIEIKQKVFLKKLSSAADTDHLVLKVFVYTCSMEHMLRLFGWLFKMSARKTSCLYEASDINKLCAYV